MRGITPLERLALARLRDKVPPTMVVPGAPEHNAVISLWRAGRLQAFACSDRIITCATELGLLALRCCPVDE